MTLDVSLLATLAVSGKKILEMDQPETKIAYGSRICERIGMKLPLFIEDLP
jgi:hypothetical protein